MRDVCTDVPTATLVRPGLVLVLLVSVVAVAIAALPLCRHFGISSLLVALLLGLVMANSPWLLRLLRLGCASGLNPRFSGGVNVAKGPLLRLAIVLFGFRLQWADVAQVGIGAIAIDLAVVSSTVALALLLGPRLFKLDRISCALIGTGSAICGAAAILASAPVLKARDAQITVAVATVVLFGTLSMLVYPVLYPWLQAYGTTAAQMGVLIGATTHEVAQVVVAGHSISPDVEAVAVVSKMLRVMLLAPFLLLLSLWLHSRQPQGEQPTSLAIPWFALGFLACIALHSYLPLAEPVLHALLWIDQLLLSIAMAALGLSSCFGALRRAGPAPLWLAALLWWWLVGLGVVCHRYV